MFVITHINAHGVCVCVCAPLGAHTNEHTSRHTEHTNWKTFLTNIYPRSGQAGESGLG